MKLNLVVNEISCKFEQLNKYINSQKQSEIMSLNSQPFEKKQRPLPPQGLQVATCYSIVDLGTHMNSYQGQDPKPQALVHFSWEFPNLPLAVFKEGDQPKPLAIFQEYSTSLGDKAKLPKMLQSWRLVAPQDLAKELPLFLGQSCYINVAYAKDKKQPEITYANVAMNGLGVINLPANTVQIRPLTNQKVFFNLDSYSHEAFIKLPEWIQKKIKTCQEWSGIVAKFGAPPVQAQAQNNNQQFGGQQQNQQAQGYQQQQNPQINNAGFNQPTVNNQQNTVVGFGGEIITGNPFTTPPF